MGTVKPTLRTADELREIAIGEQSEAVNKLLNKCMDEMLGEARKGERRCFICIPSGTPSPVRCKTIDTLAELGYTVEVNPTAITVKW